MGQSIAVISLPLECTADNGQLYSFIPDFFDKEKIVHFDCLKDKYPGINCLLNGEDISSHEIVKDLQEALRLMGESVDRNTLELFVLQNALLSDIGELVKEWLKSRKSFD